ncbi:hypothetical protein [Corynebacterium sp.]|nr:hypothetical protein [Corynebacterium sp.]HHU66390.1 hypothetical protein [Corynebacterium sp.]
MTNNTRRRLLALGTAVGLACTLTPAATAQEGSSGTPPPPVPPSTPR